MAFRGRAQIIISYHNFESTPQLDALVKRMTRIPADAYKIVTSARKPSDNARVLALAKAHSRTPLVVLAVGELGFPTRVLSPAFGGMYTYASPLATQGTAAGQVSARQLQHLYRIDKISKLVKVYGVIADPIRHSISPAVHNRAFQARRLDCRIPAVPGDASASSRLLPSSRQGAHLRFQRHHSAQAKSDSIPGRRGPGGPPHRRG